MKPLRLCSPNLRFLWLLCAFCLPTALFAQHAVPPGITGWLGLYNSELIGWLENENWLSDLCPESLDNRAGEACRKEKLAPKELVIQLWHTAEAKTELAGLLTIRATPGRGLQADYQPADSSQAIEFRPDLFDVDWGYGPYFHQTYIAQRGTWYRLPADPFPAPVWIDTAGFTHEPALISLAPGKIITFSNEDYVVLAVEQHALQVRREQEADVWCEEGKPPPLLPGDEVRLPAEKLYSPNGHLLVDIKYKRGC